MSSKIFKFFENNSNWLNSYKNLYLGIVHEDGSVEKRKNSMIKEHGILDFGDGYLLYEFLKKTNFFPLLSDMTKEHPEIIALIIYRICYALTHSFHLHLDAFQ